MVCQVQILCPDLREELLDLQRMLSPPDQETAVLKRLCHGRRKYIGHLLDSRATGIVILRQVTRALAEHLATQIEVKFFLTNDFEKFDYVNGLEPSKSEHSLPSR